MNGNVPLMLLAAVAAVSVPAAMANQAELDRLSAQLEEISARYGFPAMPDLTDQQWQDYNDETQPLHEQAAASYERLEEMWQQYDAVVLEIEELDIEGEAIDAKYGFDSVPELTQEQWDEYGAETDGILQEIDSIWQEMDSVWQDIDEFWAEYDEAVSEDPDTEVDLGEVDGYQARIDELQAEINELYTQIGIIDINYGFDKQPELTDEQWDQYVAEWDALEARKVPYYERLESIMQPYQADFDAIDGIEEQIRAVDARYGISHEAPEMTDADWAMYMAETEPIAAQINALEAALDEQRRAVFEEAGIIMPEDGDPEFFEDFARLLEQYPQLRMIGDSSVSQERKDQAYADLAEAAPEFSEVFERHGYSFPLLTADEFRSLDQSLAGIGG